MSLQVITMVVSAAADFDLVSLADLKEDLSISGTAQDKWLKKAIARSSAAIARYCNRVFPAEQVLDTFYVQRDSYPYQTPGGVAPLQASRWPILRAAGSVAAPSVSENGEALVEGTDYVVDYDQGQLTRLDGAGSPTLWPATTITAEYTGGYSAIPDDVQDACARLVKARWFARNRDPLIRSQNFEGVYEAQYFFGQGPGSTGDLPPDVREMIDRYRVPAVA